MQKLPELSLADNHTRKPLRKLLEFNLAENSTRMPMRKFPELSLADSQTRKPMQQLHGLIFACTNCCKIRYRSQMTDDKLQRAKIDRWQLAEDRRQMINDTWQITDDKQQVSSHSVAPCTRHTHNHMIPIRVRGSLKFSNMVRNAPTHFNAMTLFQTWKRPLRHASVQRPFFKHENSRCDTCTLPHLTLPCCK